MKKLVMCSLLLCCIMFFVAGSAFAVKPGETVNPNGFPEGFHFNLNIHGKKLEFNCPEPFDVENCPDPSLAADCEEHDDEYGKYVDGVWKYSGSLFIPVANAQEEIKIVMESGKSGGGHGNKHNTLNPDVLEVIDPCTADFDGDAAVIQLPPCDGGYDVYARALATPTGTPSPSFTINDACLDFAEDKDGNPLFFLGSFGENWFKSVFSGTFTRVRGKNTAVDITKLFEFTGNVCYVDPSDPDCFNPTGPEFCETLWCTDTGSPDPNHPDDLDKFQYVTDNLANSDGVYDVCVETAIGTDTCLEWVYEPDESGGVGTGICYLDLDESGSIDPCEPTVPTPDASSCANLTVIEDVTVKCTFHQNEWIFDIPDFAQYFWDVDNNGLKLLQLRFYPRCDLEQ